MKTPSNPAEQSLWDAALKCGKWSHRVVSSAFGAQRILTLDRPAESFWALWHRDKETLRAFGVSIHKQPHWYARWIQSADAELPKQEIASPPVDTSVIPADLLAKLKPWQPRQVAAAAAGLKEHGAFLDGSECGVGKTYGILATCKLMGKRPVIICPLQTIPGWKRALAWFGMEGAVTNYEQAKFGKRPDLVKIVHEGKKERFRWQIGQESILIFDEAQAVSGWVPGKKPPIVARLAIAAAYQGITTALLSATLADTLPKLQLAGKFLKLYPEGGFEDWMRGLGAVNGNYGWWLPDDRQENLAEVHRAIFGAGKGIRLRKMDIPEFPEIDIGVQLMELGEANTVRLCALHREQESAIDALHRGKFKDADKEHIVTIRRKIEALTVPAMASLAKAAVDEGCSVPIFVNFRDSVRMLCDALGTECFLLGGMDPELRERNRADFHEDRSRFIIGTLGAGDIGIDLDDVAGKFPRWMLIRPGIRTSQIIQANGRHHRANSKSKATTRLCWVANSPEEDVAANGERKLGNLALLNDGELDACPMAAVMKEHLSE